MQSIENGLHEALDRGELLRALRGFKRGDFSIRMPINLAGIDGEIALALNDVIEMNEALAGEFARVSDQGGKEGRTGQRANVPAAVGS
jgi:hypothetical protein